VRLRRAARAKFEPSARHHAQLTTAARPGRAALSITFATPSRTGRIRVRLVSSCTESNGTATGKLLGCGTTYFAIMGSELTVRHTSVAAPLRNSSMGPLCPGRCYVQRVGASHTLPGQ
jgi:hypothetical protein